MALSVGLIAETLLGGNRVFKLHARHRVAIQALGDAARPEGLQLPSPLYQVDADTVRLSRIREQADNDIIIGDDLANIFEPGIGGHAAHGVLMRIRSRCYPKDKFVNCECHQPETATLHEASCQTAVQVRGTCLAPTRKEGQARPSTSSYLRRCPRWSGDVRAIRRVRARLGPAG